MREDNLVVIQHDADMTIFTKVTSILNQFPYSPFTTFLFQTIDTLPNLLAVA